MAEDRCEVCLDSPARRYGGAMTHMGNVVYLCVKCGTEWVEDTGFKSVESDMWKAARLSQPHIIRKRRLNRLKHG